MKKLISLILIGALALSAAACGDRSVGREPMAAGTPPNADSSSVGRDDAVPRFAMDFAALLADCRDDCQPGAAGSSLRAAALCARLADLFTDCSPAAAEVTAGVEGFVEALRGEEADLFSEQLQAVCSMLPELTGDHGADLLDSCGYTPAHTWETAALTPLFDAMKQAIGTETGDLSQTLFARYGEPVRLWGPEGMAYFQVKLFSDHALREWGSDTEHTEHDGLAWSISGDVLTLRGDWNEQFTLDLSAETATSLTDGHVYRLCGAE